MIGEIESIKAAQWLAENGTEKVIIESLLPKSEKFLKESFKIAKKNKHRFGIYWIRDSNFNFMADRAYRLFIDLFSAEGLVRRLSVVEFSLYCQTYLTKYPQDEMSANRLHYLIQAIRTGDVVVISSCKCCAQPFVVHRYECLDKICHICRLLEK